MALRQALEVRRTRHSPLGHIISKPPTPFAGPSIQQPDRYLGPAVPVRHFHQINFPRLKRKQPPPVGLGHVAQKGHACGAPPIYLGSIYESLFGFCVVILRPRIPKKVTRGEGVYTRARIPADPAAPALQYRPSKRSP